MERIDVCLRCSHQEGGDPMSTLSGMGRRCRNYTAKLKGVFSQPHHADVVKSRKRPCVKQHAKKRSVSHV